MSECTCHLKLLIAMSDAGVLDIEETRAVIKALAENEASLKVRKAHSSFKRPEGTGLKEPKAHRDPDRNRHLRRTSESRRPRLRRSFKGFGATWRPW